MDLQIHNTMTRRKEPFEPIDPANVRMYVCGPTVYDYIHIGNARPIVVFDVLFRLLRHLYGEEHVTYARNITDVEDKINNRAKEEGIPIEELTRRTTEAFHRDIGALNALPPSVEPRATGHIAQMIELIETLIGKGHAYEVEGHVLFSVTSDPNYGCLSGRNRDEMIAGARVEVAPYKKDAADFVLWKPSTPDIPGWDSPWGRGRPGWHIECSAMSSEHLGETFDIHGGGVDLVFPHHENEVAQSTCGTGESFAKYWMHNGYVVVGGEKMSKSLGNFITLHELIAEFPGEAIRLALLSGHYRAPLDITREKIQESRNQLDRIQNALLGVAEIEASKNGNPERVAAALSDDLNTPLALSELHGLASRLNKAATEEEKAVAKADLLAAGELLGLLQTEPNDWFKGKRSIVQSYTPEVSVDSAGQELSEKEIEALIEQRNAARKAKDFATADRIRDELAEKGILLEDGSGGTTWKRA